MAQNLTLDQIPERLLKDRPLLSPEEKQTVFCLTGVALESLSDCAAM